MRYPQARWLSPQRANRAEPAITVRAYVSQVGVVAAKAIARANGMTASQEAAQGSAWRVETNRPVADPAALMTASDRPVSNKRRRAG
jgi:hypothetical protein